VFNPERKDTEAAERKQTVASAASELDLNERTIYRYFREGCPHTKHGRLVYVNAGEIQSWLKSKNRTGKQGGSTTGGSADLLAIRIRRETALAEKYEDERDERRRKLVAASEIQSVGADALSLFKNTLMGMPSRLVPMLQGRNAGEQQEIIETEISDALRQLADDLRKLGISDDTAEANQAERVGGKLPDTSARIRSRAG